LSPLMPRRKQSPHEEARAKLARYYEPTRARPDKELDMIGDVLNALWSPEFPPPYRATDDELAQWVPDQIVRLTDAHSGKQHRAAGSKGKGKRRAKYKGKPILREQMRATVLARHEEHPTESFNRVRLRVATSKDFGYNSAWSVKEACKERPAIKWSDPRRRQK